MLSSRFRSGRAWGVALLGLAVGACSGSSSGGGPTDGSPRTDTRGGGADVGDPRTADQFKSTLKEIFCGSEAMNCCTTFGLVFNPDCAAFIDQLDRPPGMAPLTFNPGRVHDCIAFARFNLGQCALGDVLLGSVAPCGVVFSGAAALGESCEHDSDCAQLDGHVVSCSGLAPNAQCKVLETAAQGQSCSPTTCARGADVCRSDTNSCDVPSAVGGPCGSSRDCFSPFAVCSEGKCRGPSGAGQPCGVTDPLCDRGLACGDDHACAPAPRSGEPCDAALPHPCEDSSRCGMAPSGATKCFRGSLGFCREAPAN